MITNVSFLFLQFNYLIPAVCCIFIFLAFGEDSYTSSSNFAPTFLLLILYGYVELECPFSITRERKKLTKIITRINLNPIMNCVAWKYQLIVIFFSEKSHARFSLSYLCALIKHKEQDFSSLFCP